MSFTDRLQRKSEERREGRSAFVDAAAEAEARVRTRVAPLVEAVAALVRRLAADPMFANGVGRPQLTTGMPDTPGGSISVRFSGRVGSFCFWLREGDELAFEILPGLELNRALACGRGSYTGAKPLSGHIEHLDAFLEQVEDHIAEFIADVHGSPAAHLLEPGGRRFA